MRVWIDTDVGSDVDDALTIAYVLRHPDLELAGISTVFGDVELRSEIARSLLGLTTQAPPPILTGRGIPITPERIGLMFGHEGKGIIANPAPRMLVDKDPDGASRIEALAEALEKAAPDVLVAIGPLTNLGALVAQGATLPPLAIMGGKIEDVLLEGMVPEIPEWNWYCDPLAVQTVLQAPHAVLPTIIPAEVTFRTHLLPEDIEQLQTGDALAQKIGSLSEIWLEFLRERFGRPHPRVALHDPLTAATLVRQDLCRFAETSIEVDEKAASLRTPEAPNIRVATDVNNDALREHLMATWLG